ncbi:MAG: caspase family protein [Rhodomicrobiaceae bacterium]
MQGNDGRYYLTPSGFRLANVAGTGLAWSKLADVLGRSKARVIVILDACHSGLSGSEGLATNDEAVKELLSGARAPMLVLAASKGRQVSFEDSKWSGGVFTYALSEILQRGASTYDLDRNGTIELSELYRGLREIVTRETKGQQTPWLARQDLIGDFALF